MIHRSKFLGWLSIGVTAVAMLWMSWGRWPDAVVDFGRELYVPWQLAEGKSLYTEIAFFNGPLSQYFNAALFAAVGPSLGVITVVNLVILALIVVLLYQILRIVGGHLTASVGCVAFLTLFGLAKLLERIGNYNYLSPYSHEATHGVLLCLLTLRLAWSYLDRRPQWSSWLIGVVLGLVFLTKAELFVAAAAAVGVVLMANAWTHRAGPAAVLRDAARVLAGLVIAPTLAFALLSLDIGPSAALIGTLGTWPHLGVREVTELSFYREMMGIDDIGASSRELAIWSARYLLVFVPVAFVAVKARLPVRRASLALCMLVSVALAGLVSWWMLPRVHEMARPLPVIMVSVWIGLVLELKRTRGDSATSPRWILALALTTLSFTLLAKMLLNSHLYHYGFVLAMPATMTTIALLVSWVPELIGRGGGAAELFRLPAATVLIGVCLVHAQVSWKAYERDVHPVGVGADRFLADERGIALERLLTVLDRRMAPGDTLAVLPEGVMLNYLSRRPNPTPYINFMPPELLLFGEDRIMQAFRDDPPDWLVLTNRGTEEYGLKLLGKDYGIELMHWVQDNYTLEETVTFPERRKELLGFNLIVRYTGGGTGSPVP